MKDEIDYLPTSPKAWDEFVELVRKADAEIWAALGYPAPSKPFEIMAPRVRAWSDR